MSWLYSQALVEEYSEDTSLDGAPCALWNGKPTQLPSWCNDKTMARCQLSQSGTTFKPLTDDLGEDVLTSFLEAFPAKTSVAPAKEQESKESDLPCGRTWRESLEKFDLNTHTWRTHQCLWDEDLQPSSVILPKWGMMRSGVLWERTTLPPLTSGTGSGSWRTPECAKGGTVSEEVLNEMAAGNWTRESGHLRQLRLQDQVRHPALWPTPTCQEVEHPDAKLTDTGRRLSKDGKSSHSLNLADSVKQSAPTGQLNPNWVEWLMGWPIGWTSMEAITKLDWRDWSVDPADEGDYENNWQTPSVEDAGRSGSKEAWDEWIIKKRTTQCRLRNQIWSKKERNHCSIPRVATGIKNRVGRLKAIGNGQVPQVAAMAWKILTKDN